MATRENGFFQPHLQRLLQGFCPFLKTLLGVIYLHLVLMAKWQIAIDRGGTFTDVWARELETNRVLTLKLLSEDQEHYDDGPREAIRRIIVCLTLK